MFRSIWKGFKWFFSVKEKTHSSIGSKRGHVVKQPEPEAPIKIKGPGVDNSSAALISYNRMQQIHNSISDRGEDDLIESAKRGLWVPHSLTDEHKRIILANCGFQKTFRTQDGFDYDPRLIQVINYAMNMYSAEFSFQVETVLSKSSIVDK